MNCIIIDDDKVSRLVIEKYIQKVDSLNLINSFDNAIDAANYFSSTEKEKIDLVFLDIEMPGMTGVEFLESLENLPQIIVVSAKEKYAIDAIQHDVADYLLKPIVYPRFLKSINKIKKKNEDEAIKVNPNGIFVKDTSSTFIRIFFDDILYIEAMENYIVITTKECKHTIHFTMKAILDKLPSSKFYRIHRSYIVNTENIDKIKDNMIIFDVNNKIKSIPISKSYKTDFFGKINIV